MNYFYSQNHQQLLSKLVNDAVFPTLIEYLHHHQEEDIILRELKKNFDQLHSEAEGAGVGKASGGTKKELPNHLGNSSHCVSSGVWRCLTGY